MTVFEIIEEKQKGKENTAPFMVGEQLKEICRREPGCAAIVMEDLQNPDMGLEACEKKIRAWADSHRGKSSCVCVALNVAEGIIREFYGLPASAGELPPEAEEAEPKPRRSGGTGLLELEDFLL